MKNGGVKWGLVTFALGIMCGVIGHYLQPPEMSAFAILLISVTFAIIGAFSIDIDED